MIDRVQFPSDEKLFQDIPEKGKNTSDATKISMAEWCQNKMRQEFTPEGEPADEFLQQIRNLPDKSYGKASFCRGWQDLMLSIMELNILSFLKKNNGYIGQFPDEKITHLLEAKGDTCRTIHFSFFETSSRHLWPESFQPLADAFADVGEVPDDLAHKRKKLVVFPLIMLLLQILLYMNGTLVQIVSGLMAQHPTLEVPAVCACAYWALMLFSGALVPFLMRESRKHWIDIIWYTPVAFVLGFLGIMQVSAAAIVNEGDMTQLPGIMCIILAVYFAIESFLMIRRAHLNKRAYDAGMKKYLDSSTKFIELMERNKDELYRYIRFLKLWDDYCGGDNMVYYRNKIYKKFEEMYKLYQECKKIRQK